MSIIELKQESANTHDTVFTTDGTVTEASASARVDISQLSPPSISILEQSQAFLHQDGNDEIQTVHDDTVPSPLSETVSSAPEGGQPYSVFTKNQKRFIVFMASWAGLFSPISSSIYFPALNALAAELNVSDSMINLTLTSYMIFQGLAPAFIGNLADTMGRRPAYTICFIIYTGANIGLALQDSYAALFILRCLQSTGASGTIAMASAIVSDIATPSERGAYMGLTMCGSLLGPAFGPVLGGILSQFLGWRSIFWFLVVLTGVFMSIFLVLFPETARTAVGNGSIPPHGWNMSLMNYLTTRKIRKRSLPNQVQEQQEKFPPIKFSHRKLRFPNPLSSLIVVLDKENALLLFYNAFLYSALYDIITTLPSQFSAIFGFNDLQIGLCYIPFGLGSMVAALMNGQLLDRNFARWCRKLDVSIQKGRDQDLRHFPIEKARLEVAIPASYMAACFILIFGWVLNNKGPFAVLLVTLFFASFSVTVAFNVTGTLLVDFYPNTAAAAAAANNLVRCLLGAGATALLVPMVNGMGRGWTFTFLSSFLVVSSPMLWSIYFLGIHWREQRRIREERTLRDQQQKRSKLGTCEEGKPVNPNQNNASTRRSGHEPSSTEHDEKNEKKG